MNRLPLPFAAAIAVFLVIATPMQATAAPKVVAISAGDYYTLFLMDDGTLWGTGENIASQFKSVTGDEKPKQPVKVMTDVAAVSAGYIHTLIVKKDGTLWATGVNFNGEFGDGTTNRQYDPVKVTEGVTAVSAGADHSLFLKTDGTLWGMGSSMAYQLLTTNKISKITKPKQLLDGVVAFSAGGSYSTAVKKDGTLWGVGNGAALGFGSGKAGMDARQIPYKWQKSATDVVAVWAARGGLTAILKTDGSLWATGQNSSGQLGLGNNKDQIVYDWVKTMDGVASASVSLNGDSIAILKKDGTLWIYGQQQRFFPGYDWEKFDPMKVDSGVAAVTAGLNCVFYIKKDGTVWAAGEYGGGKLGIASVTDPKTKKVQTRFTETFVPVQVKF